LPDPHDLIVRGFISFAEADYGWDRQDRFTNISDQWNIRITDVSAIALDPEDVGFDDIYGNPGNWPQVAAAAAAAYPQWHYFGGGWWTDINPPYTSWTTVTLVPQAASFPLLLAPGEGFVLQSSYRGDVGPQAGELVTGWAFEANIQVPGAVSDVSASQRPDATKLVAVHFVLTGEAESYAISVEADDGSESWGITPSEHARS